MRQIKDMQEAVQCVVGQEAFEYLKLRGEGTGEEMLPFIVDCYRKIAREYLPNLSHKEWCYLCDVTNGTIMSSWLTVDLLVADVEDADRLDGLGKKWDVEVKSLCKKLTTCGFAGRLAVVDVLLRSKAEAWKNHGELDIPAGYWKRLTAR